MGIRLIGNNMKNASLIFILAAGLIIFAFAYLFILGDTNKAFLMAILASNIFILAKLDRSPNRDRELLISAKWDLLEALVPAVCQRCAGGQELVLSAPLVDGTPGGYAHRETTDGWLHDCRAHALHSLLDTSAEQIQSND